MKFIRGVYTIYTGITFVGTFLFLLPVFFVIIQVKPWRKYGYNINKFWARIYFRLIFKKIIIDQHGDISKKQVYIYCPNHFSYLDVPVMGYAPNNITFVGKSELAKVPLFGYMFRNLHITVDRESKKASYATYQRCSNLIKQGRSLVLFPEGGITSKKPPAMGRFKDGPFRIAIEQQIPIIPVTIPYNWIILPERGKVRFNSGKIKVIFHQPIETKNLSIDEMKNLKAQVFDIIDKELIQHKDYEG